MHLLTQACALLAAGGGADGKIDLFGFEADGNAFKLTLWTLITFVVVLYILWTFAWGPILEALEQRTNKIKGDIDGAAASRKEAEGLKAEYDEKLSKAREDTVAIIEEGKRDAQVIKDETLGEAREEAAAIKARAEREAELGRAKMYEEVWDNAAELATELAGKLISRDLKAADHKDLIAQVIDQYKTASAKG